MTQLQVNQFSHGILNPGLGCLISCLGSFLGLRCLTRARACLGRNRAIWLLIASVAIGGTGIWVTHVVAMLGYTIPGQQILYNVPMTVISLGVTISVLIAIVTCAAGLAAGLRVRGVWSSLGVSMVMGVAITGMHYTGMAAMRVYAGGSGLVMAGEPSSSLLLPLLLGTSLVTFLLMLIVAMSPDEDEILADASLTQRLRAGASLAIRESTSGRQHELTQPDVFGTDLFQPDVSRRSS